MASLNSLPLYEKIPLKNTVQRTMDILIFVLLLSLLTYRLLHLKNHGSTWLLAFLCESWFTFVWVLVLNIKWNRVIFKTYPNHLLQGARPELPSVDMFVTTADPVLEPPILTVNTVLSLLAVDYPAHKLACYVSDDGCSPLTYYSLIEASKFAKLWVPFCRKHDVQVRAPSKYFSGDPIKTFSNCTKEFQHEWKTMENEYEQLSQKIEVAAQNSIPPCDFTGDFEEFSNVERKCHPTIIKVMWENKECLPDGLPHLVYISREKKHNHPHHNKAGAMNVLTRVSALMTNAPYMLNVDCDMFVNNPKVILHAMCVFLDSKSESEIAFVQFPQRFYAGLKDDPYGNQLIALYEYIGRGMDGIQGPLYGGTGCFHRRKIIYGLSPDNIDSIDGKLAEALFSEFGNSKELIKSTVDALKGKTSHESPIYNLQSNVEAACQVAGCGYEYGTCWGTKMGWIYGSTSEDVKTGLMIHEKGWRSVSCTPEPPAFLGCAPSGGPASMTQQKRWASGSLEVLFSRSCPIFASLSAKLHWRQCLAYLWILTWGLRSIFELCYVALPAYCIISGSHFLPKVEEPALYVPVSLFLTYNLYTLSEYLRTDQSVRAWWNNQRMTRVTTLTAWLFGFLSVLLKIFGLSETVFEVTQKEQSSDVGDNNVVEQFTFNESPIFVPGTTILLVHLTTLVVSLFKLQYSPAFDGHDGYGLGEAFCSVWLVLCFWPFFKGLFGKGKHGIPKATIYKSATLAFLFMYWCRRIAMG